MTTAKFCIKVVNSGQDEKGRYVDFVQVAPTGDVAPFESATNQFSGTGRLYFTSDAAIATMSGFGRAITLAASNPE